MGRREGGQWTGRDGLNISSLRQSTRDLQGTGPNNRPLLHSWCLKSSIALNEPRGKYRNPLDSGG